MIKRPNRKCLPIEVKFFKHIKKTSYCWIWTAHKKNKHFNGGYGDISWPYGQNGIRHISAHRLSWQIHFGEIPKGKYVCHKCDNPPCVNPKHLFIGDSQTNVDDMISKGRINALSGEKHPRAKLKLSEVSEIREILNFGGIPLRDIGLAYGVCHTVILDIKYNLIWKSASKS